MEPGDRLEQEFQERHYHNPNDEVVEDLSRSINSQLDQILTRQGMEDFADKIIATSDDLALLSIFVEILNSRVMWELRKAR